MNKPDTNQTTSESPSCDAACSPVLIPLRDTRIEMAGVMRCCLGTVAEEYADPQHPGVSIGMTSCCRHCSEPFTLVAAKPHPMWKPDWVIRKENAEVRHGAKDADLD
jgi:hypothetical protein